MRNLIIMRSWSLSALLLVGWLGAQVRGGCFSHEDCGSGRVCGHDSFALLEGSCMIRENVEELLGRRVEDDERIIDSLIELTSEDSAIAARQKKKQARQGSSQRVALKTGKEKEALQINVGAKGNLASISSLEEKLSLTNNGKKVMEFEGGRVASFYDLYVKDVKVEAARMRVNQFEQWQIYTRDSFELLEDKKHWNEGRMASTECGGVTMLGGPGHTSTAKLTRKFEKLPAHKELRIKFFFHYIDAWSGEVGYLKTRTSHYDKKNNLVRQESVRWTEGYDFTSGKKGANICGNESVDENKFLYFADVQFPHSASSLEVEVGSTLTTDPGFSSFGISSFQLYYI